MTRVRHWIACLFGQIVGGNPPIIGKLVARRLVEMGVGPGHGLVRASDALFNGGC